MMEYAWCWVKDERFDSYHQDDPSRRQAKMIEDGDGEHIEIIWWNND